MLKNINLKYIIIYWCFIIIPTSFCSAQTILEGKNFITKEKIIEKALYPGGAITEGEFTLNNETTLKWNIKINSDGSVITTIESPKESTIIRIYSDYLYGPGHKKEIIKKGKIIALLTSKDSGVTWIGKNLSTNENIIEKALYPGGPIIQGEVKFDGKIIKKWYIIISKDGTTITKIEYPLDKKIIEAKAKYFGGPPFRIDKFIKKKHTLLYLTTEDYIHYKGKNLSKNKNINIKRSFPGQGHWRGWHVTNLGGRTISSSYYTMQYILLSIFNLELE